MQACICKHKTYFLSKLYLHVCRPINNPSGIQKPLTTNSKEIRFFYPCNLLTLPVHIVMLKYQSKCGFEAFKYVVQFSWKFYVTEQIINYLSFSRIAADSIKGFFASALQQMMLFKCKIGPDYGVLNQISWS